MDAILLAGGFGTRLRPLTYTRPKPLLPVAGRPMVEWALDQMPDEVDRVIVAVNWLADELEKHFEASERDVEFVVVHEDKPLGTGGAVKNCESHIEADVFLVLNADIVSDMDQQALVASHGRHGGAGTISLKEVAPADVVNYGVVEHDAAATDGSVRIRRFVEKPKTPAEAPSRLINAGAYLLQRSVLDLIPAGRLVSMEKEIFPQLIPKGFYGLPFDGAWIDVGDPARLLSASTHVDGAYRWGPHSFAASDAQFEDSVAGTHFRLGAGSRVLRSVLGDRVTVRDGVRVEDSIVGDDETVSHDAVGARIWSRPVPAGYPDKQVGNTLN